jgi:ATP-dependent helicase HepA
MVEFVQGQRWVVDSEPELGLGLVMGAEARSVTLFFPLGNCERRYAIAQAPLTRIVFSVEDSINLQDGSRHRVTVVREHRGLMLYELADGRQVPETQLGAEIQLNQPFVRLMTGQLDRPNWFYFRRQLDAAMTRVWASRLNGLLGVRANLIAHQLYVAHTACHREQVRVLLADEVGLGKTLEAGMILNRLLKLERASRALIVVPDALQVQWLVELIRRFSLMPSIYDGDPDYDFDTSQIHILRQSALVHEAEACLTGEFDVVIVDEAHHILPGTAAFEVLSALSRVCLHLVLVTATPEQLGFESHFARLKLLDSDKYTSLEAFAKEEAGYARLNEWIRDLPEYRSTLIREFGLDADLSDAALINQVLDCHGVGRVMFRNVRASVKGFPARIAQVEWVAEAGFHHRIEWLAHFLKANPKEKVLCIVHEKARAVDAENYLWQKHGIDAALFHEDMDLIERDRAAAYFADAERGSQVLLCSEIGSEGRNFQFSHHLVCLDLPDHPDMLEQRIGRLDRIGQTGDVNIHVVFAEGEEDALRWQWYHEVLNCVARQNPAAGAIHDRYWVGDAESFAALLPKSQDARLACEALEATLKAGRDALLEMNSCRQPAASELVAAVAAFEAETPASLIDMASQLLNFHFEDLGTGFYSLIPSDSMLISMLPGIPAEGAELTFRRDLACSREDVLFMTWDSPLVLGLWELLHSSELGSAAVALLPSKQLPAGRCLLEACFDVVVQSEFAPECWPFFDSLSVRSLALDVGDKDLAALLGEAALHQSLVAVDKKIARKLIAAKKDDLPKWYAKAEEFAATQKAELLHHAEIRMNHFIEQEIQRLVQLSKKNPAFNHNELAYLQEKQALLQQALQRQTHLQLSALRLIVTTEVPG